MASRYLPNLSAVFILCTAVVTASCSSDKGSKSGSASQLAQFDGLALLEPQFKDALLAPKPEETKTTDNSLSIEITETSRRLDSAQRVLKEVDSQISHLKTEGAAAYVKYSDLYKQEREKYDSDNNYTITKSEVESVFSAPRKAELDQIAASLLEKTRSVDGLKTQIEKLSYPKLWFTHAKATLESKIDSINQEIHELKRREFAILSDIKNAAQDEFDRLQALENMKSDVGYKQKIDVAQGRRALIEQRISKLNTRMMELQAEVPTQQPVLSDDLETQLVQRKKAIAARIQQKEKLEPKEVLEALLLKHFLATKKPNSDYTLFQERLKTISTAVPASTITDFKSNYEGQIASLFFENQPLAYNRDAVSASNIVLDNRMQCYSGTTLFLALSELSVAPHAHKVVIFTSGHVLPGYIEMVANEPHLVGVETTSAGKAVVRYGKTKSITGAIRVFDAHQFLFIELFKEDLTNFEHNFQILQTTMEKYGFKKEALRAYAKTGETTDQVLNASPLAFGKTNVPAGDQKRESFDQQENKDFRVIEAGEGEILGRFEHHPDHGELVPCENINISEARSEILLNKMCLHNDGPQRYGDYVYSLPARDSYTYSYNHIDAGLKKGKGGVEGPQRSSPCYLENEGYTSRALTINFKERAYHLPFLITVWDGQLFDMLLPYATDSSKALNIDNYLLKESKKIQVANGEFSHFEEKKSQCTISINKQQMLDRNARMAVVNGIHVQVSCPQTAEKYTSNLKTDVYCVLEVQNLK